MTRYISGCLEAKGIVSSSLKTLSQKTAKNLDFNFVDNPRKK
jgi:hypothetical protein